MDLQRLPEIWKPESPVVAGVFEEIPAALGVPGVHLLWRLLANFPLYLGLAWPALAIDLQSASFAGGAALRQAAIIPEAVGLPSHKAFRGDLARAEIDAELREKIEHFNDLSQIALSRLLLAASLMRESARGRGPVKRQIDPAARPAAIAASAVYVPPLLDEEARGKAQEVLMRVRSEHGLPFVDDYLRSLARIPDYLGAAWNAIRPLVGDPEYLARARDLSRRATSAVAALPAPLPAMTPETAEPGQAKLLAALLDCFADRMLPQALIDVTLIKALTSGPDRAAM